MDYKLRFNYAKDKDHIFSTAVKQLQPRDQEFVRANNNRHLFWGTINKQDYEKLKEPTSYFSINDNNCFKGLFFEGFTIACYHSLWFKRKLYEI